MLHNGASVTDGRKSGVTTKLTDLFPQLIIWHRLTHRLELAVGDAASGVYRKAENEKAENQNRKAENRKAEKSKVQKFKKLKIERPKMKRPKNIKSLKN